MDLGGGKTRGIQSSSSSSRRRKRGRRERERKQRKKDRWKGNNRAEQSSRERKLFGVVLGCGKKTASRSSNVLATFPSS